MENIENEYTSHVRELAADERPRERLAAVGAEALSDAQLLAIILRGGTRKQGVLALARALMTSFGNLQRLSQASLEELCAVDGIGPVKAIEIKAALELGKRMVTNKRYHMRRICGSEDVIAFLMPDMRHYETEQFICIELTTKNEILKKTTVSSGGMDSTAAMPRDVFKQAIRDGASAVIIAHNHPSGDPEPSEADIAITRRLVDAAHLLGIRLLDHVVIGDGRHVSFRERGLL